MTTLTGCPSKPEPQPEPQPELKDLVVVTQTDSINGIHEENSANSASITLDAPVEGPQALLDAVMALANSELYAFCEFCAHFDEDIASFSKEEMYTKDGAQLLNHYMEKYKPLIQDSVWNVFDRTLAMEAQTDLFVTYGVEHFHCGASCGSEKYYYTFDKKDGHQIGDIISHENLVRFFEELRVACENFVEGRLLGAHAQGLRFFHQRSVNSCAGLPAVGSKDDCVRCALAAVSDGNADRLAGTEYFVSCFCQKLYRFFAGYGSLEGIRCKYQFHENLLS